MTQERTEHTPLPAPRQLTTDLRDYYMALTGEAGEWSDKPHRLMYDLVRGVAWEREQAGKLLAACEAALGYLETEVQPLSGHRGFAIIEQLTESRDAARGAQSS